MTDHPTDRFAAGLLLFAVTLCALEPLPISKPVKLIPILLFFGYVAARPPRGVRATGARLAAVFVYLGLTVVALFRAADRHASYISFNSSATVAATFVGLAFFLMSALLSDLDGVRLRRRLLCACFSPAVFVTTNLVAYLAGVHVRPDLANATGQRYGQAVLLAHVGVHRDRAQMPFTPGVNGNGIIASLALVITAVIASRSHGRLRRTALAASAIELLVVLLADSRGPFVCALVSLALVWLLSRRAPGAFVALPALIPIMPLVALAGIRAISGLGAAGLLSRGADNFAQASGRVQLWRLVWGYLKHPHFADIYGHGAYGQVATDISYRYAYLFRSYAAPELSGPQSIAFQTVLDVGYVGLAALVVLFVVALRSAAGTLWTTGLVSSAVAVAGMTYLILIGALEIAPSPYISYTLASFLILVFVAIRGRGGGMRIELSNPSLLPTE